MRKVITLLIFIFTSLAANSWTEKWPTNIQITQSNFVSEFLRANLGKLGEIAANELDAILKDPNKQAKLAKSTVDQLNKIYNKYQADKLKNENQAREAAVREFTAAIEQDINWLDGTPITPPISVGTGALEINSAYSAKYGVNRLTWKRIKTQASCQRQDCRCPDGSTRPGPGYFCNIQEFIGGQYYYSQRPVACTVHTDTLDLEAGYEIQRNGKTIASIAPQRSILSSTSLPITGNLGAFSINLSYTLPVAHRVDETRAGPFYDYDPHNENYGTALKYTIKAKIDGCGNYNQFTPYWNNFAYVSSTQSDVTIDADGDGKPDNYPRGLFFQKRLGDRSSAIQITPEYPSAMNQWSPSSFVVNIANTNNSGLLIFYANGIKFHTIPLSNGRANVNVFELASAGAINGREPTLITIIHSLDGANPTGWNDIQIAFERD